MTFSVYDALVPALVHGLSQLKTILDKASAYAEQKKFDSQVLVQSRLAPDMFPLSRQLQIMTDIAKGGVARLAGLEVPSFSDTETTVEELQARLDKTLTFIKSIDPKQFDNAENREIKLTVGKMDLEFIGKTYLSFFVLPNFYFHYTTVYAILRHQGVDVGKMDFLGKPQ